MAKVQVFTGIYKGGTKYEYGVGEHIFSSKLGSVVIPEGLRLRVYQGNSKADWYGPPMWEGEYDDLTYYNCGWWESVLEIKETENTLSGGSFATFKWSSPTGVGTKYPLFVRVPVGSADCPGFVQGKEVQHVEVPDNSQITIFESRGLNDGSLTLGPGNHDVKSFGILSYNFRRDAWKLIATSLDLDNAVDVGDDTSPLLQSMQAGNSSNLSALIEIQVSDRFPMNMTSEWDAVASANEVTGNAIFESVTTKAASIVGGGFGQLSSDGLSVELIAEGGLNVDPFSQSTITMITDIGKRAIPASETYQNERTGEKVVISGSVTMQHASASNIRIEGGSLADEKPIQINGWAPTSIVVTPKE